MDTTGAQEANKILNLSVCRKGDYDTLPARITQKSAADSTSRVVITKFQAVIIVVSIIIGRHWRRPNATRRF